jgi:hypothetical protein
MGYVGFFLIYTGRGMELTNQYVNTDTNKTSLTVIKLWNIFSIMAILSGWTIFTVVQS